MAEFTTATQGGRKKWADESDDDDDEEVSKMRKGSRSTAGDDYVSVLKVAHFFPVGYQRD